MRRGEDCSQQQRAAERLLHAKHRQEQAAYERQYRVAKKARIDELKSERALCLTQLDKLHDKQYEESQSLYAMQQRDLGARHCHQKGMMIDLLHKTRPPLTMLPAKPQGNLGTAVSQTRPRRLALPAPSRGGGGPGSPPGGAGACKAGRSASVRRAMRESESDSGDSD